MKKTVGGLLLIQPNPHNPSHVLENATQPMDGTHVHLYTHTHTHTRLTALCPGLPGWADTRKVKPIWILLKQETVSGSGISWAVYMSAPRSRQITTPVPHHSVFYRPDALPATQPTASKHWRQHSTCTPWGRKKNHFSSMNKSFLRNVIGQNLELLLLVNNIVDITDMNYRISTNFYTFLCQKCYVGYYVINHGVYTRRSCCNKLLRQNYCIKIKATVPGVL